MTMQLFLGVSGCIGSGKTTISELLAIKWGFLSLSFGKLIKDLLEERGEQPTRTNMQRLGQQIIATIGHRGIAALLLDRYPPHPTINYTIDGVRHLAVHSCLKELLGRHFKLLFVDAPAHIRLARIQRRNDKDFGVLTLDDLRQLDNTETEIQTFALRAYADFVIQNDRDEDHIQCELESLLSTIVTI